MDRKGVSVFPLIRVRVWVATAEDRCSMLLKGEHVTGTSQGSGLVPTSSSTDNNALSIWSPVSRVHATGIASIA